MEELYSLQDDVTRIQILTWGIDVDVGVLKWT
jgi:hypothetical protein